MRNGRQKPQRTVIHKLDEEGNRLILVPLDDDKAPKYAMVYEIDYEDMMDLGLSPMWRIRKDRKQIRVVVGLPAIRQDVAVARIIIGAGEGQAVGYANGNPLDLRSSNLVIDIGKGLRKELDLVYQNPNQFASRTLMKHVYLDKEGKIIP
jgi:hypothetical protein